jgi:type II secretory pathway component PulF
MLFFYFAKNQKGENQTGQSEADNLHDLAGKLREENLILISAELIEKRKKDKIIDLKALLEKFGRVPLVEKMIFSRSLSLMVKAGLPLNEAMDILAKQSKNPRFSRIIRQIGIDISRGESFSVALSKYPNVFNKMYVGMIQVGETGGNLEEIMKILAIQLEKDHQLISRVRGALIYPAVIVLTMVGIGIFMMVSVVPKLTAIFSELNVELPLATQVVIGFSNFLKNYFILGSLFLIVFIIAVRFLMRVKEIKKELHKVYLRLPIFGKIIQKINSARFARTFSSLFQAGVPIVKGLTIVSETLTNYSFKESLLECSVKVQKGEELSKSLSAYGAVYPIMVIQMVKLGEETGNLSDVLKNLADFYEDDIDNTTKNLSSVIEPVLMLAIGLAIGFFAVSMIQPMYSIMGGL